MHNELFNPIDIFTYHPSVFQDDQRWTVLTRDLFPEEFLDFVWTGRYPSMQNKEGQKGDFPIKPRGKAVGFKSFPDHWTDGRNEDVWRETILEDFRIKKIILRREDELAVYISMLRADQTGRYMTHGYPSDLRFRVDPAQFQGFLDRYRDTFQTKYKSPITYEQLIHDDFEKDILPLLWKFLNVDSTFPLVKLRETVKQADPLEDLSKVIENYEELEFSFRHTEILHFKKNKTERGSCSKEQQRRKTSETENLEQKDMEEATWSMLLPICSRGKSDQKTPKHCVNSNEAMKFDSNRLFDLSLESQHDVDRILHEDICWSMLEEFARTLWNTASLKQLQGTEAIVGIDADDLLYSNEKARLRIESSMPCKVVFVTIQPEIYGKVCRIWNFLAKSASNDFLVLLGDDIRLLDAKWQMKVVQKFHEISKWTDLPFGVGCVALNDLSFPGFPTFPVLHRWHVTIWDATSQAVSRVENTIGGDGDARYRKYRINWCGQILNANLLRLRNVLGPQRMKGTVIDVVVPSIRTNNNAILEKICNLRATVPAHVKFWIVVDNPIDSHVSTVTDLQTRMNNDQLQVSNNYFINVIHYSENYGASYARNTGYNYSTADYIIFFDDDVVPDENLVDAYIGAIRRYPDSKVYVGLTELPQACNLWTEMLSACNSIYPMTGGGEDIDFVYQYKRLYAPQGQRVTVGVPEAMVFHPWWRGAGVCYRQIVGWARGDALCITEWPEKTFLAFPNWVEHVFFIIVPSAVYLRRPVAGLVAATSVIATDSLMKGFSYFEDASRISEQRGFSSLWRKFLVGLGAGSVLSSQEITRTISLLQRYSLYSLCRRVDWFDGQKPTIVLDIQLKSAFCFFLNSCITTFAFGCSYGR
ncbi:glycosyl transferase family 2 protein [Nitzschia inconspicua]|uniref:Glycosyl transferase family 2 protein n=1 Tax=Nitzschia inconspicua TaxID=303405 RepID=A0A9K3KQ06_9STRA|nr:glycosyl transferase family 2 protein [Nitzschia inconspicua]